MPRAGLYVVATPIGNLEDITYRAVRLLSEVDLVAAEDTRHSRVLFSHYGIDTPMQSLHEHNETQVVAGLVERVAQGSSIALISDAGTPLISDPGYLLVCAARDAGLPVYAIPGPSALTAALSVAGLPTDKFSFEGFLPSRASARKARLEQLRSQPGTLVFYESSHRIEATVSAMAQAFGSDRLTVLCRELTKKFETVIRAPLDEIGRVLSADANQKRGEFVIVVAGHSAAGDETLADAIDMFRVLKEYLPASQAARVAAKLNGVPRRKVYRSHTG